MQLRVLPETLAVCRLDAGAPLPEWALRARGLVSITRTAQELSVVCEESCAPVDAKAERGWRAFEVAGPLDFSLTGILASIATPLAAAGVSLFAVSTFDTDYVLVRAPKLEEASEALATAGFEIL